MKKKTTKRRRTRNTVWRSFNALCTFAEGHLSKGRKLRGFPSSEEDYRGLIEQAEKLVNRRVDEIMSESILGLQNLYKDRANREKQRFYALRRSVNEMFPKSPRKTKPESKLSDEKFLAEARKVGWLLLPPGKWPKLDAYFKRVAREDKSLEYDPDRIRFLRRLKPREVYVGEMTGQFYGYCAAVFENTSAAILEHPYKGNAIYVLHENWEVLARFSKWDLLEKHGHVTDRIIHSGAWQARLRSCLARLSRPARKRRKPGRPKPN